MKLDFLLADGEVAVVELLRHGVETVTEIEVDERRLLLLHLIKRGCLLEMAAQVSELVVMPNLFKAQRITFLRVPDVVEVKRAGIFAAICFGLGVLGLQLGCLRGLGRCRFCLALSSSAAGTNTGNSTNRSFAALSPGVMKTLESK